MMIYITNYNNINKKQIKKINKLMKTIRKEMNTIEK